MSHACNVYQIQLDKIKNVDIKKIRPLFRLRKSDITLNDFKIMYKNDIRNITFC